MKAPTPDPREALALLHDAEMASGEKIAAVRAVYDSLAVPSDGRSASSLLISTKRDRCFAVFAFPRSASRRYESFPTCC